MAGNYVLDEDGNPVLATDMQKFALWFRNADRILAKKKIGDVTVSTIFLGFDHGFGGGKPVLWETMIFGGFFDEAQRRYDDREDALRGHALHIDEVVASQTLVMVKLDTDDDHYYRFRPEFHEWTESHMRGAFRFFGCGDYIGFERAEDAAIFKLSQWYSAPERPESD